MYNSCANRVWWVVVLMFFWPSLGANGAGDPLAEALALVQAGQYDQAIKAFSPIISGKNVEPEQLARALEGRCTAYFKQSLVKKKLDLARQAVLDCNEAIRFNGDSVRLWRLRGLARLLSGSPDKALINFDHALRLHPKDALLLRDRGVVYLGLGRLAEAEADFRSAKRLDPDVAWHHFNQGIVLARQGKTVEAEAALREFIRLRGAKAGEFLALVLQNKSLPSGMGLVIATVLGRAIPSQVAATPSAANPVAATPVAATPSTAAPVAATPVAATPSAAAPVAATPSAAVPFAASKQIQPVVQEKSLTPIKEYVFKVGSFQDSGNIQDTFAALSGLSIPIYQEETEVGGRVYYRIWAGPFASEAQARVAHAQVQKLAGQHPESVRLK